MRLVALVTVGGVLVAHLLGCAQVTGIEDISSSAPAQHCVDTVNMLRSGAMLPPVKRWTDEEQCADQFAQAFAGGNGTAPACVGTARYNLFGDSPVAGPDAFFQSWVNSFWNGTSHGYLGESTLTQVACGYGVSGNEEGGVFVYTP